MSYSKLSMSAGNAVRFGEVVHVLVRHGFADIVRRSGLHNRLPARMLRGLNLTSAPTGEPTTFGQRRCAALTELGPTFVKFGQILSTRPDLTGPEVARELSELQDNVAPLPFEQMRQVIEESLELKIEEAFGAFDETPVASASLSQVYRATLKTGEAVAIKVQRPNIEAIIESDINLMRQLSEWLEGHLFEDRLMDPSAVVDEFARSIQRELDFTIEARIIEQFRLNFEETPEVFIPQVYTGLCRKRVLTMDWVDGVRVDQFEAYPARNCEPRRVAVLGCEALCKMVFEHHLFHADPHPGNIFIMRDNRLAFLDLGMAGHLERVDVAAIAELLYAMFRRDAADCVDALMTVTAKGMPENRELLEHEIAEFIAFEAQAIVGGGQVSKGIERATHILRRFNLELAPRFSLLLKALGTIELVGRKLDPNLDMVPIIQPYVEQVIAQRFHPREMMREAQENALALVKLSRQVPGDLSYLLHQLRRGKLKFTVHHEHLENLAATIDRSSNRNTVGIIVAAIILGSSLLITTDSSIHFLGVAGYLFAALLGVMLIVSILWNRRL